MSSDMIGYMLGYARRLDPRFELHIAVLTWQCGKYKVFISGSVPFRHPFPCIHGKGKIKRLTGFLHDDIDAPLLSGTIHIFPFQDQYIADSQAAVAGEQERSFDILPSARSVYENLDLVYGQELPLALRHLDFLVRIKPVYRIFGNDFLSNCRIQRSPEASEVGNASELRQLLTARAYIDVTQEVYKGKAEVAVYVPHGRLCIEGTQHIHRVGYQFATSSHSFFLLTFLVCLHPVEKQHLRPQGGVLQPCHSIG